MADQARKKAQKRLKRERKRQAIRKASAISPFKRIASEGELLECWVNSDWRERGQAAVYALCRAPDGTLGFATFFVDTWCAGLKEAYGRLNISHEEFGELVEKMSSRMDDTITGCEPEEAREIVAGGIRFAIQNGFRLPPDYKRWAAFLGEMDVQHADLSAFGKDGGLLWVGPMHDLQARLIGSTVKAFFARPDVDYVMEMGSEVREFDEDDIEEDDVEDPDKTCEIHLRA